MREISLNKALAVVERKKPTCRGCFFRWTNGGCELYSHACKSWQRKDGKNVIFKLVDYRGNGK